MKATFLDRGTFPARIKIIPPKGIQQWEEHEQTNENQRLDRCQNAEVILTNKVILNREIIQQLTNTRLICVMATGINNVDIDACREHGIAIVNATAYGTQSVSEHVLMLMLALIRNLPTYLQANQIRSWSNSPHFCDMVAPLQNLHGKTLAIFGMGTLGNAVAHLAKNFGMDIIQIERPNAKLIRTGYTEFNDALNRADFISLHCPLNEDTQQLINKNSLAKMKSNAFLINTGRGGLVNESDLLAALEQKIIAGAALDVADQEPPKQSDTIWQLSKLSNVILTPHVAWAADEAMEALVAQIMQKITCFLEQKPFQNLAQ